MGMYTGYQFHLRLRPDTPQDIITLLQALCDPMRDVEAEFAGDLPKHPFFLSYRWDSIFTGTSSYFYDNVGAQSLVQTPETGSWTLHAISSTKGFSQAAPLLIDWLKPWLMAAPWEVLAISRHEEQYDYNAGYAHSHSQYWLVGTDVVKRSALGDVDDVELPLWVSPTMNYQPVQWQFGPQDGIEVMSGWPLDELGLSPSLTEAIRRGMESVLELRIRKNRQTSIGAAAMTVFAAKPTKPEIKLPAGAIELMTNHPDIRAWRMPGSKLTQIAYPWGFNPNDRKTRKRRNLAARVPRQQARGYYMHSHKGRKFRRGLPRPRMATQVTVKENPNRSVAEALKP